jgi:OOP family OmpA-OmpF porin
MKRIQLLGMLAFLLPLTSQAQGWYAGLDVGSARSDAEIDEHLIFGDTTARSTDTTTGFRVRGGYQFGRFFALEVAYVDLGELKSHFDPDDCPFGAPGPCSLDVRTSLSALVGTLHFVLPIHDHWYLDARLGWGKMDVDTDQLGGDELDTSIENPVFHYGIGAGYRFNEHWDVALDFSEYNQEDFGLTFGGSFGIYNLGESSVTSLGVGYRW